jgi:hypothetical protein
MRRIRSVSSGLLAVALATAAPAHAQVSVAPTILFTSDQEPFGTFVVNNASDLPQEIVIEFRFGYPKSDASGNSVMEYDDVAAAERFGLDAWVQAFPRRFVLAPGQNQVVRMAVRPPPGLEDGTYWTRLITTTTPQGDALDTTINGVAARIVTRLQHVTTLVYGTGGLTSSIQVGELTAQSGPDRGSLLVVPLQRAGNTPFLGWLVAEIRDESGRLVTTSERAIAVYFDAVEQLTFDPGALPAGLFDVTVTIRPGRPDVPPEHVVGGDPVQTRVTLEWP